MTHSDIYTKFMIEYDKANITSSYPSLTKYEIATILDKAYLALIAQKLTGNNTRKVGFEGDIKSIEDLRPLMTNVIKNKDGNDYSYSNNDIAFKLPSDMLYFIDGQVLRTLSRKQNALDGKSHIILNAKLIDHNYAKKFMSTDTNLPWISDPVVFLENKHAHVLVDPYKTMSDFDDRFRITYIKKPAKFATISNVPVDDYTLPTIDEGTSSGGTNDSTQTPSGGQELNPVIWQVMISGETVVYNSTLQSNYIATCSSNTGLYKLNILWSIVSGNQYASISDKGELVVNKNADNNEVIIKAQCIEVNASATYSVHVSYYNNPAFAIKIINSTSNINNKDNSYTFEVESNGTVVWRKITQSDLYTLDNGVVTVLGNIESTISFEAYVLEDPSKVIRFETAVKYNSNQVINPDTSDKPADSTKYGDNPLIGKIYRVDEYTPWSPWGDLKVWTKYYPDTGYDNYKTATCNLGAKTSDELGNFYIYGYENRVTADYSYDNAPNKAPDINGYHACVSPLEQNISYPDPATKYDSDFISNPWYNSAFFDKNDCVDYVFNGVPGFVTKGAFYPYPEYPISYYDNGNPSTKHDSTTLFYLLAYEVPGNVVMDDENHNMIANKAFYGNNGSYILGEMYKWNRALVRPLFVGEQDLLYQGPKIKNLKCIVFDFAKLNELELKNQNNNTIDIVPGESVLDNGYSLNKHGFSITAQKAKSQFTPAIIGFDNYTSPTTMKRRSVLRLRATSDLKIKCPDNIRIIQIRSNSIPRCYEIEDKYDPTTVSLIYDNNDFMRADPLMTNTITITNQDVVGPGSASDDIEKIYIYFLEDSELDKLVNTNN